MPVMSRHKCARCECPIRVARHAPPMRDRTFAQAIRQARECARAVRHRLARTVRQRRKGGRRGGGSSHGEVKNAGMANLFQADCAGNVAARRTARRGEPPSLLPRCRHTRHAEVALHVEAPWFASAAPAMECRRECRSHNVRSQRMNKQLHRVKIYANRHRHASFTVAPEEVEYNAAASALRNSSSKQENSGMVEHSIHATTVSRQNYNTCRKPPRTHST